MSREWHDVGDGPDEHGGKRPFRPDEIHELRREFGGWSVADVVTIALLVLLLGVCVAVLLVTVIGGVCPPCEVTATA